MEQEEYQSKLGEIRVEIDAIDQALLPLFMKRMQCSERVAALKRAANVPVLDASREQKILDKVKEQAGEYGGGAAALYAAIMAISRARQHQLLTGGEELRKLEISAASDFPRENVKAICQGVPGAYSHKAAQQFFSEDAIDFLPSWKQVFQAIEEGKGDFGILPVENSEAGSVSGVYDLILKYRFYIVGAVSIPVQHCLAAAGKASPITKVISHPQGLQQCSEFIESRHLSMEECSNTAAAAQYISKEKPEGVAAICSKEAAEEYGLTILQEEIQNSKNNHTRFVVISKVPYVPVQDGKISLCFSLPHTTGSLYNVLERFAIHGLNLTKIESRPISGSNFEYDFYLDFTGNIHEKETLELICSLHDELPRFSFLGNYIEIS